MEWQLALIAIFGGMIFLLMTGLPVPVAFLIMNVIGIYYFWGGTVGLGQLIQSMSASVASFVILPFPLFILLGEVLFRSGMARRAIDVVDLWLGQIPGRLSLLAVASGVVSSALSGSGVASAAMLSSTLVPEMERRGYKLSMSAGPIMGSGGIAMIIPPSGTVVLVASLAFVSIGQLLIAGIVPGVLLGILYATYVLARCYLQPHLAPPYEMPPMPLYLKLKATILNLVPIIIIIFLVTGVIILGIASPSEAAAMGALGAFILAAFYRSLTWNVIKTSILNSCKISVMLLSILLGAMAFSQILAYTGAVRGLVQLATSLPLPPVAIVIIMMMLVLILGCFMDEVAILLMIIPIYMPIIAALGINPIWFLIIYLINMEMGLTTPPFGLILFAVKGVLPPNTRMVDLYKAAFPFLVCDAIVIALIIAIPQIALWLPGLMVR